MKLYRTKAHIPDGLTYRWDGTQADAGKRRKELKADGCKEVETEEIDVPTSKAELLAWLNANANTPGE